MGVVGLWTVVHPSARPTNLTTLHRKRLAVDASIWIYQFLKAVRDKEGNALRNSHVIGFFRRICKLLYHGIKPVFVFDGGAPALKRQTISSRKQRREGRRDDAVRTAGKMLAVQMQRRAEEEEQKRKDRESGQVREEEELPADQELVYVDEIGMDVKERQQNRTFRKKDAYHLPDLDISLESMGAPNDPRVMSQQELEDYAKQFHSGEDINLYDFSKIDFESPFFVSLPASDRYNILNAARLRSRLRMGYSKEQLDGMFPDRMAFSRFQIDRVRERNELTQRLMHINGMSGEDFLSQGARIAGEKGKEYVLVKNDGVEGGWALGVVSNKDEGQRDRPIDIETYGQKPIDEEGDEEWEDQDDFEDVPIEGLNRLPKKWAGKGQEVDYNIDYHDRVEEIARKRRAVYDARRQAAKPDLHKQTEVQPLRADPLEESEDPDSLFLPEQNGEGQDDDDDADELFEDVDIGQGRSDDEDLQKAIAMSLDQSGFTDDERGGFVGDAFNQANAKAGREIGRAINQRANGGASNIQTSEADPEDDDDFDLQTALAESRRSKYKPRKSPPRQTEAAKASSTQSHKFSGPLPFESLNLGQSLLGKKKSEKLEQDQAGGFEKESTKETVAGQPLPPWFTGEAPTKETVREPAMETEDEETYAPAAAESRTRLRRNETREIIDIDAPKSQEQEVIDVDASDEAESNLGAEMDDLVGSGTMVVDSELRMDDVADLARAEPPVTDIPNNQSQRSAGAPANRDQEQSVEDDEEINWSETDEEELAQKQNLRTEPPGGPFQPVDLEPSSQDMENIGTMDSPKAGSPVDQPDSDDEDVEFEDVEPSKPPALLHQETSVMDDEQRARAEQFLIPDDSDQEDLQHEPAQPFTTDDPVPTVAIAATAEDEETFLSDSDDEILRNLAIEAEEHARFVSTLNNALEPLPSSKPPTIDYEAELRQLRNQQKRDRRDADEVTQTMITECQMLLSLFGLPYVTAPMEAEAQCAELVHLGLVDGIITDDSDVFLFGGTRIYKNMFNAAKFVECYLTSDLEREYNLTREKLISFAHLLGSDYTEGIPGVGPVTALEILTEFPEDEGGLTAFRDWWSTAQLTDPKTLSAETTPHFAFLKKYRKQLTRLFLPPHFPDQRVEAAYLDPEVDSDPQPFQWGVPDLNALRHFLMSTIGWSQDRTDEILVPVIRDMNRRETEGTQSNITRFFAGGVGVGARHQPSSTTKAAAAASKGISDDQHQQQRGSRRSTGTAATVHAGAAGGANEDADASEVFAPRVRESGRMSRAFGRLRGEAERKRKRQDNATPTTSSPLSHPVTESTEIGNGQQRSGGTEKRNGDESQEEGEDESDFEKSNKNRKTKGGGGAKKRRTVRKKKNAM